MGRLAVVVPENGTEHLAKVGDGLFMGDGKIAPVADPDVLAGGFESSNVNGTFEMVRMIEAMRSFETHLKALQTLNELTRRTVNDISVIA
jgi:flagellar basal body rod protein FlgG